MEGETSGFESLLFPPPESDVLAGTVGRESDPVSGGIRVLPAGVAAGIAAGETIERPASVVKELVENSLDAGASAIRIDIRGGGLDLIRVGDDGCGIRAADLWLACQRHATSKYPPEGLAAVRSLGFRGEALPSITAVAELDIVSATNRAGAWRLTLRGGRVLRDEPAARTQGTTVTVRGLFADLPARRSTFGGAATRTESSAIAAVVRRLALAAPGVRFALHVEDRLALQTSGAGDWMTTLAEIYGHAIRDSLLPLGPVDCGRATISGVIAGAEVTRPGRSGVTMLVNGRPVNGRSLQAGVEATYRPLLPRGRHPVLLLAIDVDPSRVDVNVHPAKLEVRIRDEREIANGLAALVRDALGRRPLPLRWTPLTGAAALEAEAPAAIADEPATWDDDALIVTAELPPLRLIGQVAARLLLLEGEAGLYLVDQHRAHERILYERMRAASRTLIRTGADAVDLPEPLLIEVPRAGGAALVRRLNELRGLGFELEEFGGRAFLLRRAPAMPGVLAGSDDDPALSRLVEPIRLVSGLAAAAEEAEVAGDGETWEERLLVRLACRTAVRRGQVLDRRLMRALVEGLGATAAPAVCPHGSPLLIQVGSRVLEREFGWT